MRGRPFSRIPPRIAGALLVLVLLSCMDGIRPDASEVSHFRTALLVAPRISALSAAFEAEPVNRIRLTARHRQTGVVLAAVDIAVNPNDGQYTVEFEVELAGDQLVPVEVDVELLDGEVVQWAGRLELELAPQLAPVVHELAVFRGPLDNYWAVLVAILEEQPSVLAGGTLALHATVQVEGNQNAQPHVFWLSLDPSVATVVEETGVVTGVSPGVARIVAIAGQASAQVSVTVEARPASVRILPESAEFDALGLQVAFTADVLDVGGDVLNGAQVTWSSGNPAVAAHEAGGTFVSVGNGVTTAIATSVDDPSITASAPITVRQTVAGLDVLPTSLSLVSLGETAELAASPVDREGHDVGDAMIGWSSASPDVASVDANGRVTAVGPGVTTITVTASAPELVSADGLAAVQQPVEASVTVEVTQAPFSVLVTPSEAVLGAVGATQQFEVQILDALGVPVPDLVPVWSSTHPEFGSIDAAGLATAHSAGTTTIQAAVGDLVGEATLTVVVPDLIIRQFEVLPGGEPGTEIDEPEVLFRVEVQNVGGGEAAETSISIAIFDAGSDAQLGEAFFAQPPLGPGGIFVLEELVDEENDPFPDVVPPSEIYFKAKTDPNNHALESDETNNVAVSGDFTVIPDLTVTLFEILPGGAPGSVITTADVLFRVGVDNIGPGPASATDIAIDVFDSATDAPVGQLTFSQPALDPGVTLFVQQLGVGQWSALTLPAGVYFEARTDPNDDVAEGDETNNAAVSADFTVVPDLTITLLEVLPDGVAGSVITDTDVFFRVDVSNIGRSPASATDIAIDVFDSGTDAPVGQLTFAQPALDTGESFLLEEFGAGQWAALTLPAGVYFEAKTDPNDDVAEGDEANNSIVSSDFTVVLTAINNWTNAAGGNWSNASNWSLGHVPDLSDDEVVIDLDGTYTVTLDVNSNVDFLTVGGGTGVQTLSADGRTLTLDGANTVASTGELRLKNTTVDGTGSLSSDGLLTVLPGTDNIDVPVTQNGTLILNGNSGDAVLTVANGFTNAGLMNFTGTSWRGRLTVSAGTLTNASGATIQATSGATHEITATIDNQGTVLVQNALKILNGGQTFTTTAGTLNVAGGNQVEINGGVTMLGSSTGLVGTGTINWTGTTVTLASDVTVASGAPTWAFGTTNAVTINGAGTLINEASLTLQNEVVDAAINNQATGTITVLSGTTQLHGSVTQAGALVLNGNNGDAVLTVANGFTNAGLMNFTGTSWRGRLTVSAGTLTNASGATIR